MRRLHLVSDADSDEQPFRIYEPEDVASRGPVRPNNASAARSALTKREPIAPLRIVERREREEHATRPSTIYDPTAVQPTLAMRAASVRVDAPLDAAVEAELIAILSATPAPGETIEVAFRRKEHALGAVFARLLPLEARTLHRRLSAPAAGDMLACQFTRLVESRRARLLGFLADARRREALSGHR